MLTTCACPQDDHHDSHSDDSDHDDHHDHKHDESITSVGITAEGECDFNRLNQWLSRLLREQGADLFRSKGVLCVHGSDDK
jgi:G3E family GTPase